MKTADLIPLILLELNDCDKYGFELSKNIETKSNGQIIIKQPTLYTILKKLEKSKFISSYWEDSEIGGKRHYYKLTENGKMQVSTLPPLDILLKNAVSEDESLDNDNVIEVQNTNNTQNNDSLKEKTDDKKGEENFSIFDAISPANENIEPKESILPTSVVFENHSLDTTTSAELNKDNSKIYTNDEIVNEETFAENNNIQKFTEKITSIPNAINTKENQNKEEKIDIVTLPNEITTPTYEDEIKFVEYVNFSKQPNYIYAKNAVKNMLFRTLSTSGYLIFMIIFCGLIVAKTGGSPLFYFCLITSICVAIFYPVIYLLNAQKFRLKCQQTQYKNDLKKQLIIDSIAFVSLFIIIVIANIIANKISMLNINNFSSFYAPLLLSTSLFADLLFGHIFMTKKLKKL